MCKASFAKQVRAKVAIGIALLSGVILSMAITAQAVAGAGRLTAFQAGAAPEGFDGICGRYGWACRSGHSGTTDQAALQIATRINASVNREIRAQTDQSNYGVPERWTLPYNGRGDCEDFALLKMKRLIDAGIPASNLLLAVVAGSMPEPHVVLVLRSDSGDYVLDNLASRVSTWRASGYTFLRMQNPSNRARWDIILLGPRAVRGYVAGR